MKRKGTAGGIPNIYGKAETAMLQLLWRKLGFLSGKRFSPVLRTIVPTLKWDPFLAISPEVADALIRQPSTAC